MTAGEWAYFVVMAPFALYGLLVICVFVGRVVCDILDVWTWHRDYNRAAVPPAPRSSGRAQSAVVRPPIPEDAWP